MIEMKLSFKGYREALEALTHLAKIEGAVIQEMTPTHEHVEPKKAPKAPKVEAPKVEPTPEVKPEPVAEPTAAEMPPPPVLDNPAVNPEPAASGVPFSDTKGMIAYVMATFKEIGPQKGQGIQTVLAELGYKNINDVDPKDFGQLYAGIEALKG